MGADWEATSKGGDGSKIIGNFLPRGISVGTLVWIRDMGAHRDNESDDRGSACEFLKTGHT